MTDTEEHTACPHPFDLHSLISTTGEPMDGGIILCPHPGCDCYSTWGVMGMMPVHVPDAEETAELREALQSGELG